MISDYDISPLKLILPDNEKYLVPGNIVVLGRFSTTKWKVGYGWYSFSGNREVCGWYLSRVDDESIVKPIEKTDLYDIYFLQL